MTLIGLIYADLRDKLWVVQMGSRHLNGRKDVQTRFGPVLVSKTLIIGLEIFDIISTHMWTV